jgi:hypothetical protein
MSLSETSSTGDRGVQDADDPPVVEAGGRIISMRVSGDVVARLQKEVDAGVVAICGGAAVLELAPVKGRFALLSAAVTILPATYAHLCMTRERGGYRAARADRSGPRCCGWSPWRSGGLTGGCRRRWSRAETIPRKRKMI